MLRFNFIFKLFIAHFSFFSGTLKVHTLINERIKGQQNQGRAHAKYWISFEMVVWIGITHELHI